jgi:hypothetical protein
MLIAVFAVRMMLWGHHEHAETMASFREKSEEILLAQSGKVKTRPKNNLFFWVLNWCQNRPKDFSSCFLKAMHNCEPLPVAQHKTVSS